MKETKYNLYYSMPLFGASSSPGAICQCPSIAGPLSTGRSGGCGGFFQALPPLNHPILNE
jgi:hypothetical protein